MGLRVSNLISELKRSQNCLMRSSFISTMLLPLQVIFLWYCMICSMMNMSFWKVSSHSRRLLWRGKWYSISKGRRIGPAQYIFQSAFMIVMIFFYRTHYHSRSRVIIFLTVSQLGSMEYWSSSVGRSWSRLRLIYCLSILVRASMASLMRVLSYWLQQMQRQMAASTISCSFPDQGNFCRSYSNLEKSWATCSLLWKLALRRSALISWEVGVEGVATFLWMIYLILWNLMFYSSSANLISRSSLNNPSMMSLTSWSEESVFQLILMVNLSMSAMPYQFLSQKRSFLIWGSLEFHLPALSLEQIHEMISRLTSVMRSSFLCLASSMYFMARAGSMRWRQAREMLPQGIELAVLICWQDSIAVRYSLQEQQRVPQLNRISLRSRQLSDYSMLSQTDSRLSTTCLCYGPDCGEVCSLVSQSYANLAQKSKRLLSSSSIYIYEDFKFCNQAQAFSKYDISFDSSRLEKAMVMRQSAVQIFLVCTSAKGSFSMADRTLLKYQKASAQRPFQQRQEPMLQERKKLSGSSSQALLYYSSALDISPTASKPSPRELCISAVPAVLLFFNFRETYSQWATASSYFFCWVSTCPIALCVYALILSKEMHYPFRVKCFRYNFLAYS